MFTGSGRPLLIGTTIVRSCSRSTWFLARRWGLSIPATLSPAIQFAHAELRVRSRVRARLRGTGRSVRHDVGGDRPVHRCRHVSGGSQRDAPVRRRAPAGGVLYVTVWPSSGGTAFVVDKFDTGTGVITRGVHTFGAAHQLPLCDARRHYALIEKSRFARQVRFTRRRNGASAGAARELLFRGHATDDDSGDAHSVGSLCRHRELRRYHAGRRERDIYRRVRRRRVQYRGYWRERGRRWDGRRRLWRPGWLP